MHHHHSWQSKMQLAKFRSTQKLSVYNMMLDVGNETWTVMPDRASVAADRMFVLPLDDRAWAACWLERISVCTAFTNARPTICMPATTICAIYLACNNTKHAYTPALVCWCNIKTHSQYITPSAIMAEWKNITPETVVTNHVHNMQ